MIKTPLSWVRVAAFCLPLALVASCGNSGTEAVQGTTVNINPVSVGVASSPPGVVAFITQVYRIELRSPSGDAQINTNLVITSAGTVYEGHPVIGTVACAGTACADTALTPLTLPYEAKTDSNGTYEVTMILGFVTGSEGTLTALEAFSGTGYGLTDVVFECVDGAIPCP